MANKFEKLKELNLSRDEVERLGDALKKPEFRQLLSDYVQEVQDPENRKIYEEEIRELERERGNDITFINPKGGYVIKTSCDGSRKCFVNVCVSEQVAKPTSLVEYQGGSRGLRWSLPHSVTPNREDLDRKGVGCAVFDVVFHPNTLHLAAKNKDFKKMLNTTACDAIESNFGVTLDKKNLKFPKMKYKGVPHSSVIRKKMENFVPREMEANEKEFFDKLYQEADLHYQVPIVKTPKKSEEKSKYTTPKFVIKHRSHADIQECLEDKSAKIFSAIPKELIVEINLPLLKASSDMTLDVTEKTIQLISEKPSKYKLNLTLPYRVNQDNGNAKFDKELKKLIITLPVRRSIEYHRDDSGFDSDQSSPTIPDSPKTSEESEIRTSPVIPDFELPDFNCHVFNNTIVFTLNVKNVSKTTLNRTVTADSLLVTFSSISQSFYESSYSIFIKVPSPDIVTENLVIETWDNNVIVQIPIEDSSIEYYHFGLNESSELCQKFLEEPYIVNDVLQTAIEEEPGAIPIGNSYESSGDELSCSYSPSRSRGILKRLSNQRRLAGRSVSESSLDDFVSSSLDSAIPEDVGDVSTSLKKTVRFNDVIMRQLYRSNSSILGQKKKNQRRARNKKRAQERRHSESEASEVEDKKEEKQTSEDSNSEIKSDHICSDIFDMEMPF